MRLTWARSAAKTPIWQVNELATSTLVFRMANGMLSLSVEIFQRVSMPAAAACALVTLRMVK